MQYQLNSVGNNISNIRRKQREKDKWTPEINLANTHDRLVEEYLDRYEGVKLEILVTTRFDEN